MNIIGTHSSIACRPGSDPTRVALSFAAIQNAVARGADLSKRLLTFASRSDVSLLPLNVNAAIAELVGLIRETFPSTIVFRIDLEEGVPPILADASQFQQILLNLSVNARDAMPGGGELAIATGTTPGEGIATAFPNARKTEGYVWISVADSGTGMNEETRERIFEPFFTTKQTQGGVGLGLAVVYGIVKSHEGFIDVESGTGEGKGTTFRLYFPASASGASAFSGRVGQRDEAPGGSETILVAEDEELLLNGLKILLEEKGYRVLTARDGQEAVAVHSSHKSEIALSLIDLLMARMDGQTAFRKIRDAEPGARVILVSGNVDAASKKYLLDSGALAVLRKPYSGDEILRLIRDALDDSGQRR